MTFDPKRLDDLRDQHKRWEDTKLNPTLKKMPERLP